MSRKLAVIVFVIAAVFVTSAVGIYFLLRVPDEITGQDMEQRRDQLKVYEDAETPDESPVDEADSEPEPDIPPESNDGTETSQFESDASVFESSDEADEDTETETETETEGEGSESEDAESETAEESSVPESEQTVPGETEVKDNPGNKSDPADYLLLDFKKIQKVNPDIHAWIEIEDTKVDYPVLQSADNDNKYLTTAHDGSYYIGGSLFTQASYNGRDFNDPVTIIYGHTMRSGILFGQLQSVYSDPVSFKEHSEIKISLPGEVRYYTVFAAVPYDKIHILHVYDFSKKYWYNNFFKNVGKIRDIGANFNYDAFPEAGDRVVILSTCLNEDSTRRFLVMAILQDDLES